MLDPKIKEAAEALATALATEREVAGDAGLIQAVQPRSYIMKTRLAADELLATLKEESVGHPATLEHEGRAWDLLGDPWPLILARQWEDEECLLRTTSEKILRPEGTYHMAYWDAHSEADSALYRRRPLPKPPEPTSQDRYQKIADLVNKQGRGTTWAYDVLNEVAALQALAEKGSEEKRDTVGDAREEGV